MSHRQAVSLIMMFLIVGVLLTSCTSSTVALPGIPNPLLMWEEITAESSAPKTPARTLKEMSVKELRSEYDRLLKRYTKWFDDWNSQSKFERIPGPLAYIPEQGGGNRYSDAVLWAQELCQVYDVLDSKNRVAPPEEQEAALREAYKPRQSVQISITLRNDDIEQITYPGIVERFLLSIDGRFVEPISIKANPIESKSDTTYKNRNGALLAIPLDWFENTIDLQFKASDFPSDVKEIKLYMNWRGGGQAWWTWKITSGELK